MNTQDWSPLGWTGWISLQSKGLSRVFSNTTVQKHQFFGSQLSSLLFNMLSRLVITFLLLGAGQLVFPGFSFSMAAAAAKSLKSCPTLCDPMNHNTPGLPVHHQLPESTQTHVHQVSDAIQPSHPLSSPSPPSLNLSQHHTLFKWVSSSSHQVAKVLEFQHQSFQWIFTTDFL